MDSLFSYAEFGIAEIHGCITMELNFEIDFDDPYWKGFYDGANRKVTDSKCYLIYFDDMVKIGTTTCITRRISQLHQREVGGRVVRSYEFLEADIDGPFLEKLLHKRYKDKIVFKKEYFNLCIVDDLKKYVASSTFGELNTIPPNQYIPQAHYQGKIYWLGNDENLIGTLESIASRNSISSSVLAKRLMSGTSIKEAIETPVEFTQGKKRTLDECRAVALKYNSRKELSDLESSIYDYIIRQEGWRDICFEHMPKYGDQAIYDLKTCMESASKYRTTSEWRAAEGGIYNSARNKGWFEECSAHMESGKFTKDECLASTVGYRLKSDWRAKKSKFYNAAERNGWLDECLEIIRQKREASRYRECKEAALKYNHRSDWQLGCDADTYQCAFKYKWLDVLCSHMVRKE